MANRRPAQRLHPPKKSQLPVDRFALLKRWIADLFPNATPEIAPASSDASFRRYFRLSFDNGLPSRIIMDAPPDKEDCQPFIAVAALLDAAAVNVPRVIEHDLEQGFLLLTDLGQRTYLDALRAEPGLADALYADAIDTLVRMQKRTVAIALPPYDRGRLSREMELLPEWYIARHRGFELSTGQRNDLSSCFEALLANNLAEPQVFVHRDYHSRNLMVCEHSAGDGGNPGVLDFQDAVQGPITYDLASLLKDAYIEWNEERVLDWSIRYWQHARKAGLPVAPQFGDFYRDFEWMGLQRHLKILGIFARLYHRDGKDQYLADLPLTMRYARKTCERYGALRPLLRILEAVDNADVKTGTTF